MTVEPTIPFPASPYCRVRARVASIWADGPDDGTNPDWRPAAGEKVTLTPSIGSQLLTYDVGGSDPIIVTVERVECVVDEDGWLAKNDGRPVYIAPTDDPLLSATGWTWTASIKGKSVVFAAPSGGVVDLALFIAAPATDDTKVWVERIPELIDAAGSLVSIASVTRDGDDMAVTLTNGEVHRFPMGAQIDARVDAAMAPHIAQVNLISGLTGEDQAVGLLLGQPGSASGSALRDTARSESAVTSIAVSEASAARVIDIHARRQLTPDGRTRITLITGQPDQTILRTRSTVEADKTRVIEGAQSWRFTTTDAVTMTALVDPPFDGEPDPYPFGPASLVRALIWIDDPAKITTFNIEIVTATGVTWVRPVGTLKRGWNLVSIRAATGNITDWGEAARVRCVVVTTGATSWNLQSIWVEVSPKAQILFVEDRGYKTFIDIGLPALRARNIPVTWALDPMLNGSNVGTPAEAITDAQVAQFYAEGDDMSIHAFDGAVTKTMTADQIRHDALLSHQWLQDRGYVRGRQWRAAWTQNEAPNHAAAQPYYAAYATPTAGASMETWPFTDPYNVRRVTLHSLDSAQMDNYFDMLERTRSLMVCYTHGIHDTLLGAITPARWDYFLSKLDTALAGGWLEGVTFSQLLERSGGVLR